MRNRKLTAALQEVSKVMGEAVLLAPSNVGDSRAIRFRRNAVFYLVRAHVRACGGSYQEIKCMHRDCLKTRHRFVS